jgi:hypothetical protein
VHQRLAGERTQQLQLFGKERAAAGAEERGLVALVAVVRHRCGVPRQAVGLVKIGAKGLGHGR